MLIAIELLCKVLDPSAGTGTAPFLRMQGSKLHINTRTPLYALVTSDDFKGAFAPGEQVGFIRDMGMPGRGLVARIGGRLLHSTDSGTSKALEKLSINDAALTYEKDSSAALGFGFRCGFLGLLHLDVIQERLQREFDLGLVISAPSVKYHLTLKDGKIIEVDNPSYWPDPSTIDSATEPYIKASILTPEEFVGSVMELCREHRSESQTMNYLSAGRVEVVSEMPLGEVLFDFYGKLKMITRGYGSFDYEPIEYRKTDVVKVDILVNKEPVDALSYLVHREKARGRAMHYCEQLAEAIPRHQFKIPIQGAIGGTIIARATIQPYRKDVTAKLYGGDVTRKKKLLEKQKKGKAKMKQFGNVNIPQKAFVSVLRADKQ